MPRSRTPENRKPIRSSQRTKTMSHYPSDYSNQQKILYNEKVAQIESKPCKHCQGEVKRRSLWQFKCTTKKCDTKYTMVREKELIPESEL